MKPLFTKENVDFLEIDIPEPRIAYKVSVEGDMFYVCLSIKNGQSSDDIISALVEQAQVIAKRRKEQGR